jgi:hypothetical protein
MKGWHRSLAVLIAALIPAAAHAGGSRSWNVCGGNNFALCASVDISVTTNAVGQHFVTMTIKNLSGTNGSYSGTVLTGIGLDNVVPQSVDVVNGTLRISGPCLSSASGCDYSQYWEVRDDKAIGGGIKVDLLSSTTNGSNYSIASQCGVNEGTTPGHRRLLLTSCGAGPRVVTLSFQVDEDFNITQSGDLFIKGQNGPNGQSTSCITGPPTSNCFEVPASVVPEPATVVLLGSGLMSLMGVGFMRRRKGGSPES